MDAGILPEPVYTCLSVSFLILARIFSLRSDYCNNFLNLRDDCLAVVGEVLICTKI
jgi:hypothetical protein